MNTPTTDAQLSEIFETEYKAINTKLSKDSRSELSAIPVKNYETKKLRFNARLRSTPIQIDPMVLPPA
ncbi:hypothetical protein [Vibrio penaeicida]|uniref:Uncharacterized protein n=1 Tax=Vibrio penaeicida TaxID=104609 RepID=A0AAV5NKV2_9VIBR|nr:hypothetical protein [Vibrio penaeicida]RTZ24928.1 hypothetical protein EKN09_01260 [Vibrio penaeicida]GLQ71188.1 hypothetical protein GCM10007932_05480 [Vibrio penaeicida]